MDFVYRQLVGFVNYGNGANNNSQDVKVQNAINLNDDDSNDEFHDCSEDHFPVEKNFGIGYSQDESSPLLAAMNQMSSRSLDDLPERHYRQDLSISLDDYEDGDEVFEDNGNSSCHRPLSAAVRPDYFLFDANKQDNSDDDDDDGNNSGESHIIEDTDGDSEKNHQEHTHPKRKPRVLSTVPESKTESFSHL